MPTSHPAYPGDVDVKQLRPFAALSIPDESGQYVPLDIISGQMSFDIDRAPHGALTVTVGAHTTAPVWLQDPRAYSSMHAQIGHVHPDGLTSPSTPLTWSMVRRRSMNIGRGDTITLEWHTNDSWWAMSPVVNGTAFTSAKSIVRQQLGAPDDAAELDAIADVAMPEGLPPGNTAWDVARPAVDALGVHVFINDQGHVRWLPWYGATKGTPVLTLAGGVDLDSWTREENTAVWFNNITLLYTWRDPVDKSDKSVTGTAVQASGPGTEVYRPLVETRQGPVSQAVANATAQALLRRRLAAIPQWQLAAPARYWLRPGDLIRVQLTPNTPPTTLVCKAVQFDLVNHTMNVDARHLDGTVYATLTGVS